MHKPAAALATLFLTALLSGCGGEKPATERPRALETTKTETITLETPTPGWSLVPVAAYRVDDQHWCLHRLSPPDGVVIQVISTATGAIRFRTATPDLPTRHFVLGKTWAWNSNPEFTFIQSLDELRDGLAAAQPLPLVGEE